MARYYVYVVELDRPGARRGRPSVYVGSSAMMPEARLRHHKAGGLATSRQVRRYGVRLLPALYERRNPLATRQEAWHVEHVLRRELLRRGFDVHGACRPNRKGCFF